MEAVLNWMKGIVILFIIGNVFLYLVQGKVYEKYINFFLRLLVIIAVISPIAAVVYSEEEFLEHIAYTQFWQELEAIQKDSGRIGYADEEYCRTEYEKVVEEDVIRLLEGEAYQSAYVDVQLSDDYEIEKMQIGISSSGENTKESAAVKMMEAVRVEEIAVGEDMTGGMDENETGEETADDSTTENRYRKLREKLTEYYQIDGTQIDIKEVTA